jgi:hypothetical protein
VNLLLSLSKPDRLLVLEHCVLSRMSHL